MALVPHVFRVSKVITTPGSLLLTEINLNDISIGAWRDNRIQVKQRDPNIYPCQWSYVAWMSNHILHKIMDVIFNPCPSLSWSIIVNGAPDTRWIVLVPEGVEHQAQSRIWFTNNVTNSSNIALPYHENYLYDYLTAFFGFQTTINHEL